METVELGARIAKLRHAQGLTGSAFADRLGLTKSQVSKIESGARRVDVSELAVMADVLGVSLGELLGTARRRSLALAARVMTAPADGADGAARRRLRQLLEADSVLADSIGVRPGGLSSAGTAVLDHVRSARLDRGRSGAVAGGEELASIVRDHLGLGRAPIADLADLAERHFGIDVAIWPVGDAVSGLCAHGDGVAVVLVNSDFAVGHERFTTAHELAHHLLGDPREVVIETEIYQPSSPVETRANAFAAALLMPADGVRELAADRPVDAEVLGGLLRHFRVSYTALVYRLRTLKLLSPAAADTWLARTATGVLRAAGDSNPAELTSPSRQRRVPPRLWRAALDGYAGGRVGIGALAALTDTDAEQLWGELAAEGITPPAFADDLTDI